MGRYYGFDESMLMDEEIFGVIFAVYGAILAFAAIVGIVCYILRSISLQTIARRRALSNPWLAWLPVGTEWIIGSISDQYRYVVRGEEKSKRKILLGLSLANFLCGTVMVVTLGILVVRIFGAVGMSMNQTLSDSALASMLLSPAMTVSAVGYLVSIVSIVLVVFRSMAMYDLYRSCQPDSAVAYLVLGIIFSFLEPIFLLVVRKKDGGMPPRRDTFIPEYHQHYEPWQEQ